MSRIAIIPGLWLAATLVFAKEPSAGPMEQWFVVAEPSEVRWRVPGDDEPVAGHQNGWFISPHDMRLGRFGFSVAKGSLTNATDTSFEFRPNSVWGHYTYRATLKGADAEPTGLKIGKRPHVSSRHLAFSEVAALEGTETGLLIGGTVTAIDADRKGFDAEVAWGGKTVPCRFDLVKTEKEKRLPDFHSVLYGPHWHQAYDVYLPPDFDPATDDPAPVFVNIHGGGWGALDKQAGGDKWNADGIVYISINYRFVSEFDQPPVMTVPVAAPLLDAGRALQHIRYHAGAYGIDPERIVATGGSAGGATVAWLAMHDDMADPDSSDPIARMSTRLLAAAPVQGQLSLDPVQMREWIPEIQYGSHAFIADFPREIGRDRKKRFEYWLSRRDELLPAIREFSAYEHASADDPPMMLAYGGQKDIPVSEGGNATHHPKFGEHTARRLRELGVEVYYWADDVTCDDPRYNGWSGFTRFVKDKLLGSDWEQ